MAEVFSYKVIFTVMLVLLFLNCYLVYYRLQYTNQLKASPLQIWERDFASKIRYANTLSEVERIRIQNFTKENMSKETNNSKFVTEKNIKYVLLISTLGRSGSSWVGELISEQNNSFYVYEPDFYIVHVLGQNLNNESGLHLIRSQFLCDFKTDFVGWARTKWRRSPWNVFRSNFTKTCSNAGYCILPQKIKYNCERSTVRLIKVNTFNSRKLTMIPNDELFH